MEARVFETGEIVDVDNIIDKRYGRLIGYWDKKNKKEYSRFELDLSVSEPKKGVQMNEEFVKPIDWEERRYEIARNIMAASFNQPMDGVSIVSYAHNCVQWADALINELKRKGE